MTLLRCCFLFVITISLFISGCGKDNPAPAPPKEDSLGVGWSKIILSNILDVFFVDNNTGYAAGSALYKSTNGGVTWSGLSLPANTGISNMFWLDANHGWLVGTDGNLKSIILRTTDGGASFKKVTLSGDPTIADVQFLNKRLGYAVANNSLFISSDSGNTWTATASKFNDAGTTLFFQDSARGYIAGRNHIFVTTNGGASFTLQQSYSQTSTPYGMQFIDANTGWVPCNGGMYKTSNGGTNWELIPVTGISYDVHFFNKDQGFLLQGGVIRKTTDGGKTFTTVVKTAEEYGLAELHFTDSKHGWVVREGGGAETFILRYVEP